ncbi:MAG: replication-relaxation family protein [Pseudomonadota bacterium]
MTSYDRLGRRPRTEPTSTGKRITLQPGDLIWLRKLAEHGPLPSSYLLAFTRHLRRSEKRAQERLTDLFHEAETPHGGRYLERPPQQFRTIDSRYNQLVYDLAPVGRRALLAAERRITPASTAGPWLHRHMVACTTASIELAALARPDLSFIPGREILARATTELRYPVSILDDGGGSITKHLIPDALFGLSYHTPEGDRFRFFVVECDRATEPATSGNWNRKSWRRSLRQYQAYISGGAYRDHLRLTAPLLVLNVCTVASRMAKLIDGSERALGPVSYQLFQTWESFGPVWRPPQPNPDLLNAPWRRAGRSDLLIAEP